MLHVNPQAAKEISERLLKITGDALLNNDFDTFAGCFGLPHLIETPDSKRVMENLQDMRVVFDGVVDDYRRRQITNLVRICEVAEFRSETRIEATHITHMMSGNQRVVDPFPAFSILELIDGRWQATSSQYAVDNKTAVGRVLHRAAE